MSATKSTEPKRYDLYEHYDSWYACRWVSRMALRKHGDWVRYEDYKKLLEKRNGH